MDNEKTLRDILFEYQSYARSLELESYYTSVPLVPSLAGFMAWVELSLEADVEKDENGHDVQCVLGSGFPCDCWRKPVMDKQIKEVGASIMTKKII